MTQGLREVKTAFSHDKLRIFALFHSGKGAVFNPGIPGLSRVQSRDPGIEKGPGCRDPGSRD